MVSAAVAGHERKGEDEPCAASGSILYPDVLAMGLDERLGDGQPETGATPGIESHEPVEDRLPLIRGNPRTGVGDGERNPIALPFAGHRYGTCRRGMAIGIVQEVSEYLADEKLVDVDKIIRYLERDRMLTESRVEGIDHLSDQDPRGAGTAADLEDAGVDSSHVEKAGHQAGQTVRLDVDQLMKLGCVGVGEWNRGMQKG
jgi:hypothetical protein